MSLYGWIWRRLPGGAALKVLQLVLLAALVVVVCFRWAFPAVAPHLPFNDGTVDRSASPHWPLRATTTWPI